MKSNKDIANSKVGWPARVIFHKVDDFDVHLHKELEILLVLEGSVCITVDNVEYLLSENDLILINPNQMHSARRTKDKNTILVLQIDPVFYNYFYQDFHKIVFTCNSLDKEKDPQLFDQIRAFMAHIVWQTNKKTEGYRLNIASNLFKLGEILIANCDYKYIDDEALLKVADVERINRITTFIKENY